MHFVHEDKVKDLQVHDIVNIINRVMLNYFTVILDNQFNKLSANYVVSTFSRHTAHCTRSQKHICEARG